MRIAIVDDDIQMCEQLRTLLNEFLGDSSEISDYRSGEEFLKNLREIHLTKCATVHTFEQ